MYRCTYINVQWNLSNLDNIGPDQSVLDREVSLISEVVSYTQMWHYGQIVVSLISGVFL